MHQGLARIELPGQPERQHVFRGAARTLRLDRPITLLDNLRDYCLLGMEHIFTGYDHLAFLFGLLLVAGARGLRGGTRYILGVVTAFTVAHSVTLIAAGLGWVRLPSRFVESAIALSIAYVAVENLAVREPRHRWLLTFFFGLVHGFGFASVLAEIGLPPSGVIPSLVSFNVGVELGQLTVVCAVAPILLWLVPRYRLVGARAHRRQRHALAAGDLLVLRARLGQGLAARLARLRSRRQRQCWSVSCKDGWGRGGSKVRCRRREVVSLRPRPQPSRSDSFLTEQHWR